MEKDKFKISRVNTNSLTLVWHDITNGLILGTTLKKTGLKKLKPTIRIYSKFTPKYSNLLTYLQNLDETI